MRRMAALTAAVALLFLGACGTSGGDDAGKATGDGATETTAARATTTTRPATTTTEAGWFDRDAYVDMVAGYFSGISDEAKTHCAAGGVVDAIGMGRLEDAAVTPDQLISGDVLAVLDLDAPDQQAIGAEVGHVFFDCGITSELFGAEFEAYDVSQEGVDCAVEAVTEPFGGLLLTALDDPSIDFHAAGEDLAPMMLARCPVLGTDVIASVFADEGVELTADLRSCILEALTRAGAERDEITEDIALEYVRPCAGS